MQLINRYSNTASIAVSIIIIIKQLYAFDCDGFEILIHVWSRSRDSSLGHLLSSSLVGSNIFDRLPQRICEGVGQAIELVQKG